MVRRTKAEALVTRAQLLDAAELVFSEKGVTNTSLQEVADAAGVSRGALYHHFKNKVDLTDALLDRVMLPLNEMRMRAPLAAPDDPLSQIRLRAIHVLQQAANDHHTRAVFTILFHKCEYVDKMLPIKLRHLQTRNECAEDVSRVFVAAMAAGQLPSHLDADDITMGLFSFIDGLVYNWLLDPAGFSLEKNAALFVDIYLDGLRQAKPNR